MKGFYFLLFLSLIFQSSLTQDCLNPLLDTFGFASTIDPIIDSKLKFCKSLRNDQTCCSSDVIGTFQRKIEEFINNLEDISRDRDTYLNSVRNNFVWKNVDAAVSFARAAYNAIPKLQQQNYPDILKISLMAYIGKAMRDSFEALQDDFPNYQKARTQCFTELALIKAASWCLACDPNYVHKGVYSFGLINPSEDLCTRISDACYDYIQKGTQQSMILQFQLLLPVFQELTPLLVRISKGETGIDLNLVSPTMPINTYAQPTIMPMGCESKDNCPWACNALFAAGNIEESMLGNGGGETGNALTTSVGARRLQEKTLGILIERNLDGVYMPSWKPDKNDAEVEVTIEDNPAQLSGKMMKISSAVFILALLLFVAQ